MVLKLILDIKNSNLNLLIGCFEKKNIDFCLHNDVFYIHTLDNNLSSVHNIMKKVKVNNFYIAPISKEEMKEQQNFVSAWCLEKIRVDEERQIESDHQEELRKMKESIEKIREELEKKQQEGGIDNGNR